MAQFDKYAADYESALQQGLRVSGESKDFFAMSRVNILQGHLKALEIHPRSLLDYGCGTGSATQFLLALPGVESLTGVDISHDSLQVAQKTFPLKTQFRELDLHSSIGKFDLAFCNGVFHHIPVKERPENLRYIFDCIKPGGHFAMWENNPLNPGTRLIMSRIPFDRDAITLRAGETEKMLVSAGFRHIHTTYWFVFPRILRALRRTESALCRLPIGAQYQVLAAR